MGREVPFDEEAICDSCGERGAWDFMGDYLCDKCAKLAVEADDEPRREW